MPPDFAILVAAARGWGAGTEPYTVVGPGRSFEWDYPLIYPGPAVLVASTLSWISAIHATLALGALATWWFAWRVTATRLLTPPLVVFVSLPWFWGIMLGQWSPLMTASIATPAVFGVLLACKPTLGAALWCAYPSPRALWAAAVITLISLLLMPSWPIGWWLSLREVSHVRPIFLSHWSGLLVLAAGLRWRDPTARLILALSMLPLTPSMYEAVPLVLGIQSWGEAGAFLAATTLCGAFIESQALAPLAQRWDFNSLMLLWCVYVPASLYVTFLRPASHAGQRQ